MLPGLRFLIAAVVLSGALFIFGLGAVGLLRASHQQVANLPPPPLAPVFAQPVDTVPATLALMRVDTPDVAEASMPRELPVVAVVPVAEMPAISREPVVAAELPQPLVIAPQVETVAPAPIVDLAPAPIDPAPIVVTTPPEPPSTTKTVALTAVTPVVSEIPHPAVVEPAAAPLAVDAPAAPAAAEPARPAAAADTAPALPAVASRIATLGGPAVTIDTLTSKDKTAVQKKKPAIAKRAVKKRRVATRPRPAAARPLAPAAFPLGSPFGT